MSTKRALISEIFEMLKESEEKYKKIFESSNLAIILVDERGRIIEANPYARRLAGNVIGKNIKSVAGRKWLNAVTKSVNEDAIVEFEDEVSDRYFRVVVTPLHISNRRHALIICDDVTELIFYQRLLKTLLNIERRILFEKDVSKIFEFARMSLIEEMNYEDVLIGEVYGDFVEFFMGYSKSVNYKDAKMKCVEVCIKTKRPVVANTEKSRVCKNCKFKKDERIVFVFPVSGENSKEYIFMILSDREPREAEVDLLLTTMDSLSFKITALRHEKERDEALEAVLENIRIYSEVVDNVRNHITAIKGLVEFREELKKKFGDRIYDIMLERVEKINELLREIDEKWYKLEKLIEKITPSSRE